MLSQCIEVSAAYTDTMALLHVYAPARLLTSASVLPSQRSSC